MKSIRVGGVWKHTDDSGELFLRGKVGSFYITIRKNSYKTDDKNPDYVVYFTQPDRKVVEDEQEI